MDKKNAFIGGALIALAVVAYVLSIRYAPPPAAPSPAAETASAVAPAAAPAAGAEAIAPASPSAQGGVQPEFETAAGEHSGAKTAILENSFIRVRFTDFGGAVLDVALKKYPAVLGQPAPFIVNELHADPILAFVKFPGLDRNTRFDLVSQTASEVMFRAVLPGQFVVQRRYVIAPDQVGTTDPYQLRSETTFLNLADKASKPMRIELAVGTAAPNAQLILAGGRSASLSNNLLAAGYSTGGDQTFVTRSQLEASGGIFGLGAHDARPLIEAAGPIVWATAKGQYFVSLLTPDQPAAGVAIRRVKLLPDLPDADRDAYGVGCAAEFDVPALKPRATTTLGAELYVGPTEYHRLANTDVFKADQDRVMQFGGKFISFFSALVLTLMTKVHVLVPNWGLAIVCTTLLLRTSMLLFTIPAARSARRMQKIQPELKALKEKFKDSPQKQQAATLELFKQHKVNPVGGCLPTLFTIPFWWGFFRMLYSAAELRFAPFLWAKDLSAPDTIFSFGHGLIPFFGTIDVNIMPLLFTATYFVQMRLTPQPTVDNAQARMMKFMPFVSLLIYYSYSCALSLYSTTNGLFMIGQQLLVNRMRDDGDPAHGQGKGGKPAKNVTPGRKR